MRTAEVKSPSSTTSSRSSKPFFSRGNNPFFSKEAGGFFNKNMAIQPKLNIGKPNDPYEREADAMADKVVQRLASPDSVQAKPIKQTITPLIQTKCAECEKEEKLQKREDKKEKKELLQTKPIFESPGPKEELVQRKCAACEKKEKLQRKENAAAPSPSPSLERQLSSSKGSGSTLPADIQSKMGESMGADFSKVKIHTGHNAVQMSKNLNAQAFTHGSDIYFNEGKYDTNSGSGRHLLAHELTHTIQQGAAKSSTTVSKKDNYIQRSLSTLCNAPSSWGLDPGLWISIGLLAHLIGMNDYLVKTGGRRNVDVYLDTFELLPVDPDYAAFLIRNNPGMAAWKQVFLSLTPLKRPDYMIHRPGRMEFDELKPDSIPGVIDGVSKIFEIAGYMRALGLRYRFGTSYTPTSMIPLLSFTFGGTPVNVSLKFTRKRSGLIVYEICIETDWAMVAIGALLAILAILLALLLRRLPIPNPGPVPVPVMASIGITGSAGVSNLVINPHISSLG